LHIWLWFHSAARQIGASFRPLPVPADAQSRFETGLREDARHDRDPSSRHLGIDYARGFVVQTRDSVKHDEFIHRRSYFKGVRVRSGGRVAATTPQADSWRRQGV